MNVGRRGYRNIDDRSRNHDGSRLGELYIRCGHMNVGRHGCRNIDDWSRNHDGRRLGQLYIRCGDMDSRPQARWVMDDWSAAVCIFTNNYLLSLFHEMLFPGAARFLYQHIGTS
ncbi:hypothetical protein D3C86_1874940 [compost metagenome]